MLKNSILAELDGAFNKSTSMESYMSSFGNRSHVVDMVADTIANTGKTLQFKSNSVVASFVNSNANGYDSSKLVELLSNKLVNEIKLYKHLLFPVLKSLSSSMEAASVLMEKKDDLKMKAIEFELPEVVKELVNSKRVKDDKNFFDLVVDFDGYLEYTYDFDLMTDEDLRAMFTGGGDIASEMISLIIGKYSSEELKEFGKKYLNLFIPSSMQDLHGHKNFLSLASTPNEALQNIEELCMVWGFIRSLAGKDYVSNRSNTEREIIIGKLEEGALNAISLGYIAYNQFIGDRVLTIELGHKYREEEKKEGIRSVFVLKDNLNEFLEKAQIDAWGCIFSTYEGFIAADKRKKYYTIDELLDNESSLVDRYNAMVSRSEIMNHNNYILNCKKVIVDGARKAFMDFVEESAKAGDEETNLYNYTTVKNVEEFDERVRKMLSETDDKEISLTSQHLALKIIGLGLFDRTNFYQFSLDTSGQGVFGKYIEVQDRNFMTISGLSLLLNMLISEIELV